MGAKDEVEGTGGKRKVKSDAKRDSPLTKRLSEN